MMKILIAGCGYVGSALAVRLLEEGHDVWGLKRHSAGLPLGIKPVVADLACVDSLTSLPSNLDSVFYLASADAIDDSAYRAAYVDGIKNLVTALKGQTIRRFFFISSTRVYSQKNGEWVDEATATNPVTFAGQRLLEGEQIALNAPWSATVVRFGGIYGPGRAGLIDRIREGKTILKEGPPVYTNRIHVDDCAAVLHHLMTLKSPADLYLAVDCEPAEQKEVYGWIAARLGVPAPVVGKKEPTAYESRGESNKRCRNNRLLATGYKFLYPTFREGYGSLI
ncbi:MAG: SDR family oxidoreductase [Deltaproteobacteria bacterium]|nr:SDR family oxidoreductase [Deltaproteobacteria bacterium]